MDDVFQNVCVVALRKLDTFSYQEAAADEALVRWTCTIARFEVLQTFRARRTSKVTFDSELIEELADMQLRELELLQDRNELLTKCIERLPSREKAIIAMRYGENFRVPDLACRVGLSENGVYKALERSRHRFRPSTATCASRFGPKASSTYLRVYS